MRAMKNNLRSVRERIGVTQKVLGSAIGCHQTNVGHIERCEQTLLPEVAVKVISYAATRGLDITFDDLYVVAESTPASS